MTIANVDLVRDALSLINVIGIGEAAEPEQSEHALRKLNQILEDWKEDGVDLQFYPQTMDDLASNCPIPPDAELAVTHYLAIAVAPHYGKPVSRELLALADRYYSRLTRVAVSEKLEPVDMSHMSRGEGQDVYPFVDIMNPG